MYSLLSADFHSNNGIDPETSVYLRQTNVMPVLVYELVFFSKSLFIEKLWRFLRKTLKLIFSLPGTFAEPAVYVLLKVVICGNTERNN